MIPVLSLGYRAAMLIPKLALVKRAGGLASWRNKRAVPRRSSNAKVSKRFRRGHFTNRRANINTTAGRLILFLFWAFIVWVLLCRFLYSNFLDHLFVNTALLFPIEFFIFKIILGVAIALPLLNPFGFFSVNVPAGTGLVMSDRFTQRLHVFGPGRHITFPWEFAFHAPIRLELTNQLMDMHLRTRDSIDVIYRVNIGYRPQLPLLPLYLRTTAREISDKIGASVHGILESEVSERLSTELYDQEGTSSLEHLLRGYFAPASGQNGATIAAGLGI